MESLRLSNFTKIDLATLELCLEYSIDIKHRTLYLSEEIDDAITDNIIKGFHLLDNTEGTIWLQINSPGGDCSSMRAIYDAMRSCHNDVHTLGTGVVCSAACLLLVGGDKRYVTENCWFMAHEGQSGIDDDSTTLILSKAQVYKKMDKQWAKLMAKHTKPTEQWWIKNAIESKKELWLNANDMVDKKYGIVDEIWTEEDKK